MMVPSAQSTSPVRVPVELQYVPAGHGTQTLEEEPPEEEQANNGYQSRMEAVCCAKYMICV
jgi:hypothetical protein